MKISELEFCGANTVMAMLLRGTKYVNLPHLLFIQKKCENSGRLPKQMPVYKRQTDAILLILSGSLWSKRIARLGCHPDVLYYNDGNT